MQSNVPVVTVVSLEGAAVDQKIQRECKERHKNQTQLKSYLAAQKHIRQENTISQEYHIKMQVFMNMAKAPGHSKEENQRTETEKYPYKCISLVQKHSVKVWHNKEHNRNYTDKTFNSIVNEIIKNK